jgi:hypothetical protein
MTRKVPARPFDWAELIMLAIFAAMLLLGLAANGLSVSEWPIPIAVLLFMLLMSGLVQQTVRPHLRDDHKLTMKVPRPPAEWIDRR